MGHEDHRWHTLLRGVKIESAKTDIRKTLIGLVVYYIVESYRMVHCHDMKIGQIYVCRECGLELKVEKNCSADGKHPKGVSCVNCMHVCCDKDMVLRT